MPHKIYQSYARNSAMLRIFLASQQKILRSIRSFHVVLKCMQNVFREKFPCLSWGEPFCAFRQFYLLKELSSENWGELVIICIIR